ncbi:hypothetical protein AURDEDRAFT_177557 [Auricularia subglabra TFB-10046 SS5]|uniref:Uncharacterized protein n=1 Tax=Auricularia subglabra (strain TFB-10046 / SS5) TaxID=717982 RepID=J0WM01_AURST|nr:hypothetical protein AURDEDRAFT_177557 [Auricularia subglabra TFB-10046 SS5]
MSNETHHAKSKRLQIQPGLIIQTEYNPETQIHYIPCHLCPKRISAGKSGSAHNFLTHLQWHANQAVKQAAKQTGAKTPVAAGDIPSDPCCGAGYVWDLGSFWDSYPYHEHLSRSLSWTPSGFDAECDIIFLQSVKCTKVAEPGYESCRECRTVLTSQQFLELLERLVELARRQLDEIKSLRAKVQSARASTDSWKRRSHDHERIMLYLANNDIPKLRWVLCAALRRGKSPVHLLRMLTQAVDGLYRARGYSATEIDISFLVSALGGPRLLYALSRSHGLLSKRTIMRHLRVPRIRPSVKRPSAAEIKTNIASLCAPDVRPPPKPLKEGGDLPGHVVMFDGVAIDPRARYCCYRDQVLGLSRETAGKVDTSAATMAQVDAIRDALQSKDVRFGSEATVVALGPYADPNYYTPVPLVVSPSDKTEKGDDLRIWMRTVMDCWNSHNYGKTLHGPIWSLASDGDSTYRWAKHALCTAKKLDPTSPLSRKLAPLLGFNLYTSEDGLTTWTCDPKHVMKRFATLLRSESGVVLFKRNIRPAHIVAQLTAGENLSHQDAVLLLDPADKQNVPKAVKLLQQLHTLPKIPDALPTDAHQREVLGCLSDVLWFFTGPFITVTLSLQEQLTLLSAFSHAVDILYIKNRLAFLTGALFADTKATIKNIYFIVARLQLLDPDYLLYIILEGTDRLENVFSETRTMDHARNFDIDQLASKLATAFLIHAILQRNPHLDRGHRRLDWAKAVGMDRINPKSWKGNVRVGDVDLELAWSRGREIALTRLKATFGPEAHVDFAAHYAQAHHDMLRPLGEYVGVSGVTTDDDMRSENVESEIVSHIARAPSQPTATAAAPAPTTSAAPSASTAPAPSGSSAPPPSIPAEMLSAIQADSALPAGIDFDDFFPDSAVEPGDAEHDDSVLTETGTLDDGTAFSKVFLDDEGHTIWKAAYVTSTLSDDRSKKVVVRTLRAQGVTLEDLRQRASVIPLERSVLDGTAAVKMGDLMAFLARIGTRYALVILEIVGFEMPDGKRRVSLSLDEFNKSSKDERTRICGQILDLQETDEGQWIWNGNYVTVDGESDAAYTHKRVVISLAPHLLHPITPQIATTIASERPGERNVFEASFSTESQDSESSASTHTSPTPPKPTPTWVFSRSQILDVLGEAWESLEPDSERILLNISALPTLKNDAQLPYRSRTDEPMFVVRDLPAHLTPEQKHEGKDMLACYLCKKQRLLDDPECAEEIGPEPCGFCGRDGCVTSVTAKKTGNPAITSSCGYHYVNMRYSHAKVSTDTNHSSNVPINCPLCPPSRSHFQRTIWKYNAALHAEREHGQGWFDELSIARYFVDTRVASDEELRMDIPPAETARYRQAHNIPDSDAIDVYEKELATSAAAAQGSKKAI